MLWIVLLCVFVVICKCSINEYWTPTRKSKFDMVMQTYHTPDKVPAKVGENWKTYARALNRRVFDDTECKTFLASHMGQWAADRFDSIQSGAHKADLFRYAWLYVMGGIYADIKTILLVDIDTVFVDPSICYLVVTDFTQRIYNGVIATPPNNEMMYKMFIGATTFKDSFMKMDESFYLYNCAQGFKIMKSYTINPLVYGYNMTVSTVPDVYLFKESPMDFSMCSMPDRYGECQYIRDGSRNIFKVRYPEYPWKNSSI